MEHLYAAASGAFSDGRTPYFIVNNVNSPVVGLRLELGFPRFLRSMFLNQIIQEFRPNFHLGFILDAVHLHDWPREVSIGSFYTLITGDTLEGLSNANHPRYVPFPQGKRILISNETPEKLMNDWRTAFAEVLGPQEDEKLRNVFRLAFASIQSFYIEVDQNQPEQEAFQEWLNPTNA